MIHIICTSHATAQQYRQQYIITTAVVTGKDEETDHTSQGGVVNKGIRGHDTRIYHIIPAT